MVLPLENSNRSSHPMYLRDDELSRIISSLTTDNRKTVADIARKLLILQNLENPDAKTLEEINLVEYMGSWIQQLRSEGKAHDTIRTYSHYITAILAEIPQPTRILIDAYLSTKTTNGSPQPSTHGRIKAYKSFFRFLVDRNVLLENPVEHIDYPKVPQRRRHAPSENSIRALLDIDDINTRDRALLMVLIGCGVRASELCSLRPQDIDLVRCELTVIGKGDKQRTIPFPPETAESILLQLSDLPSGARWLFPGRNPSSHLVRDSLDDVFLNLCNKADIETLTAHYFRHFYASKLLASGVDLLTVSELLGHSSPDVTAKVYWHEMVAGKHQKAIRDHNPFNGLLTPSLPDDDQME